MQAELARLTLTAALVEAIAFAIGMWVLYHVLRAAIRDGINQSRLGRAAQKPSPFTGGD